ncbi:MAG: LTA synthase family protein [Chloroflexi bacterium]|nr:LTA synthase family protein [Chloroflexota bacterium]
MNIPAGQSLPDIYYFIVDSYGRSDLLASAYHYDNSEFIDHLRGLGFYVAECSQSNYVRTDVSLASSLNMDYLQNMDEMFTDIDNTNRRLLWEVLKHSQLRQVLESIGYETFAFATGFSWSEVDDADVYLTPSPLWSGLTEFEILLFETTPLRHLEDLDIISLKQLEGQRFRERTLFIFDSMDGLARMPGPKFVFIHIIPPHPPFVFGPNGEELNPQDFLNEQNQYPAREYAEGYVSQAKFINAQLESAAATLINESATPPVIIIQGDHGPWMQPDNRRFWILNAYNLPDHQDALYQTISPVNSFRVVLNAYLGGSYELLEDISYFSPAKRPYDLKAIPNLCTGR